MRPMKLKHAGSIVRADGGGWGCSEADSKEVVAGEEPVVSQVAGARGGSGGVGGGGSDDATVTFGNVNFRRRRQRQRAGFYTRERLGSVLLPMIQKGPQTVQ